MKHMLETLSSEPLYSFYENAMNDTRMLNAALARVLKLLQLPTDEKYDAPNMIRMWSYLYNLYDGDVALMQHWIHTYNTHLEFVPADCLNTELLLSIVNYLDSFVSH